MVAIIDYEAGNIRSVEKAVLHLGKDVKVTADHAEILAADKIILPGVVFYGSVMKMLNKDGLDEIIKAAIRNGTPFLGICVGLQALFSGSEESPNARGLRILDGDILKIPKKDDIKIPHIGWNSLNIVKQEGLFKGIAQGEHFYFVHSFYLKSNDPKIVTATTEYSTTLDVAVQYNNIYAVQFHPEKSGEAGLAVLNNFLEL